MILGDLEGEAQRGRSTRGVTSCVAAKFVVVGLVDEGGGAIIYMPPIASASPSESRMGTTLFAREHSGQKIVVRATKVSLRRSNGVHYENIGHWCPICGFQLSEAGRRLQLETLAQLMGA